MPFEPFPIISSFKALDPIPKCNKQWATFTINTSLLYRDTTKEKKKRKNNRRGSSLTDLERTELKGGANQKYQFTMGTRKWFAKWIYSTGDTSLVMQYCQLLFLQCTAPFAYQLGNALEKTTQMLFAKPKSHSFQLSSKGRWSVGDLQSLKTRTIN